MKDSCCWENARRNTQCFSRIDGELTILWDKILGFLILAQELSASISFRETIAQNSKKPGREMRPGFSFLRILREEN
jgi:hypothetical protein